MALAVGWFAQGAASCFGSPADLQVSFAWRARVACGSAEIGAFDTATDRVFATGVEGVSVVDAASGENLASIPALAGYECTSVACHDGLVAVAWAAQDRRQRGQIAFYDARSLTPRAATLVGHNPDMIAFAPGGRRLLCANEGEPTDDYCCDPEGSITIVELPDGRADWSAPGVRHIGFVGFNDQREALRQAGVRLYAPSVDRDDRQATVAEDLEPEFLAISPEGDRAWATLQENNAIAEIDLRRGEVVAVHALGLKPFASSCEQHAPGKRGRSLVDGRGQGPPRDDGGLDVSDLDHELKLLDVPVHGMYEPDAIATVRHGGETYLLTANEGDPRMYGGFDEQRRVGELANAGHPLDDQLTGRIPSNLRPQLDRLVVSGSSGDLDGDGDLDQLCCFGGRSFSVWRIAAANSLELVFDSGSDFERVLRETIPESYRHSDNPEGYDQRSDNSGPEPEGLVVGEVGGDRFAFIGLERAGGVMIYNVTDPRTPRFVRYLPPYDDPTGSDIAPEGLIFVDQKQSPSGRPLLVVCNEVSGTLTAYSIAMGADPAAPLTDAHATAATSGIRSPGD